MVFDHILQLQRQLTDKYVVVDAARPELRRFSGMTGVVKTVNFSGRALVQFDAHNNIGWFDIDPKFLKIIDAPLPPPAAKEPKAEKKAAPIKADKPAAAKPIGEAPAKPAAGSVADILAAARAGAKPAATAEAKPAAAAPKSTAEILAAARSKPAAETTAGAAPAKVAAPPAQAAPAKVDPKKLSVADMLAMARGQKPAAAGAPTPAPAAATPAPAVAEPIVAQAPPEPKPATESPAVAEGAGPVRVDRSKMSVADMLAYCRKVDGKG
jgi:hypothetical protein